MFIVGPMLLLGRMMKEAQKEYEQQCQAGNVPYDGRGRRMNWYN